MSLPADAVAEHGAEHTDARPAREETQDDGDGDIVGHRLVGYRFDASIGGDWHPWNGPNLATKKTSKELAHATPTLHPDFPLPKAGVAEVFEFMVIAHIHTVVSTIFNYDTHDTGDAVASESLERTIKRRTLLENAGRAVSSDQGELTKMKMTSMLVDFCFNRLFADWFGTCLAASSPATSRPPACARPIASPNMACVYRRGLCVSSWRSICNHVFHGLPSPFISDGHYCARL